MSNTILVTYASRAGSTVGVAEAIGNTLSTDGYTVDVTSMTEVRDISPYMAVVAGSAIRIDKWLPEAMQFIERHQQQLLEKPFAAFVVCLAMATKDERRRDKAIAAASGYLKPVRERVPTVSEGLFAGVLDLSKLSPVYRIPFSALTLTRVFEEGDYRDWHAIEQWARELQPKLRPVTTIASQQELG